VDRWPEEEYTFLSLFEALIEVLKETREFCQYMGGIDEKFSSQPGGYWEQQKCLHFLVSGVGRFVRKSLSLGRNHFRLRYYRELVIIK
jgi:hypothetical protein